MRTHFGHDSAVRQGGAFGRWALGRRTEFYREVAALAVGRLETSASTMAPRPARTSRSSIDRGSRPRVVRRGGHEYDIAVGTADAQNPYTRLAPHGVKVDIS